jgi:hypothetical protein
MVEVAAPGGPGIEVDHAEVHRPDEVHGITHDEAPRPYALTGTPVAVCSHSGHLLGTAIVVRDVLCSAACAATRRPLGRRNPRQLQGSNRAGTSSRSAARAGPDVERRAPELATTKCGGRSDAASSSTTTRTRATGTILVADPFRVEAKALEVRAFDGQERAVEDGREADVEVGRHLLRQEACRQPSATRAPGSHAVTRPSS